MTHTHVQRVRILYKTILKLHRGLPSELQVLGNSYVQNEFKKHKKCSAQEVQVFMHEWTNYALTLAQQLGLKGPNTGTNVFGKNLTESDLDNFNDEQICQLHELMKAAKPLETEPSAPSK